MCLWIEIFFVSFIQNGVKYFRLVRSLDDKNEDPDETVLKLVRAELDVTPNIIKDEFMVHTTSWRYEKPNDIYLTYLVISEKIDFGTHVTKDLYRNEMKIVININLKKPRPEVIEERHVISHGLSHISLLMSKHKEKYRGILNRQHKLFMKTLGKEIPGRIE